MLRGVKRDWGRDGGIIAFMTTSKAVSDSNEYVQAYELWAIFVTFSFKMYRLQNLRVYNFEDCD